MTMRVQRKMALLASMVLLGGISAQAQFINNAGSADTRPQLIQASVRPGEIVGNEQVMRAFIRCGTNEFLFVLPPDLHTEAINPDTLVLAGPGSRYFLKFSILGSRGGDSAEAQTQVRKENALAQYPNALNLEDFTTTVAGRAAQGLQLAHKSPTMADYVTRIVWVPCQGGVLEFTLTADAQTTKLARQAMDQVLLTFQTNEKGKLEIVRRPEQT